LARGPHQSHPAEVLGEILPQANMKIKNKTKIRKKKKIEGNITYRY
jgi:hypothetical protein